MDPTRSGATTDLAQQLRADAEKFDRGRWDPLIGDHLRAAADRLEKLAPLELAALDLVNAVAKQDEARANRDRPGGVAAFRGASQHRHNCESKLIAAALAALDTQPTEDNEP